MNDPSKMTTKPAMSASENRTHSMLRGRFMLKLTRPTNVLWERDKEKESPFAFMVVWWLCCLRQPSELLTQILPVEPIPPLDSFPRNSTGSSSRSG